MRDKILNRTNKGYNNLEFLTCTCHKSYPSWTFHLWLSSFISMLTYFLYISVLISSMSTASLSFYLHLYSAQDVAHFYNSFLFCLIFPVFLLLPTEEPQMKVKDFYKKNNAGQWSKSHLKSHRNVKSDLNHGQ